MVRLSSLLGKAARRGAVRDEAPEGVALLGETSIERVWNPAAHSRVADERSVASREAPAGKAFLLGELVEELSRGEIVERKNRETLEPIEAHDGTRRESTEASGRVVQEHRSLELRAAHRRSPTYQSPMASIALSSISACSSACSVSSSSQL